MLDMDDHFSRKVFESGLSPDTMAGFDKSLVEAVTKLINCLTQADSLSFISKHLKRELIFDLIGGSSGREFLESMIRLQAAGEIYAVNSWIKENHRKMFGSSPKMILGSLAAF